MESPRHVESYAPLLAALRREGVDPAAVLRDVGVEPEGRVTRASSQLASEIGLRVLGRAVALRGEGFAARAAAGVELASLGVLGLACLSAPTVGEALERALRYRRLVFDSDDYVLDRCRRFVALVRRPVPRTLARKHPVAARALVELGLVEHVAALRELAGRELGETTELRFRHAAPRDGGAELRRVARVQVRFGSPRNELRLADELLALPTRHGHAALAAFFDDLASERLSAANDERVATRVRAHVAGELRGSAPTAKSTARALGTSARTLTRRLAAEGTSFLQILDEVRDETALRLLRRRDLGLSEIAFLLGFSEPRAFHRAFRRWHGRTPGQVRAAG